MHLVLSGKSETVYTEMLEAVTDTCTALGFNAYSRMKVASQEGLTVLRLRRDQRAAGRGSGRDIAHHAAIRRSTSEVTTTLEEADSPSTVA